MSSTTPPTSFKKSETLPHVVTCTSYEDLTAFEKVCCWCAVTFSGGMLHWFWFLVIAFMIIAPLAGFYKTAICGSIPILGYVAFIFTDDSHKRGRKGQFFRTFELLYKTFSAYFPISLVKTAELDPKNQYIFCCHPHGIVPVYTIHFFNINSMFYKLFDGISDTIGAVASVILKLPLSREVFLSVGCIHADHDDMISAIKDQKKNLWVIPGGSKEVLEARPNTDILVLKKRRGFIKIAMLSGAHLVPTFTFGVSDTYDQIDLLKPIQRWMIKTWRMVIPVYVGRWGSFLSHAVPITTVVGAPIEVPKVDSFEEIDNDVVDEIHEQYISALKELYNEYKGKYALLGEAAELTIK